MIDSAPELAKPSRRERKKREARQRIYQAAVQLFLEKGFEATTVNEIAGLADVAKGTVFNYFPHKTSFLAALAGDWTDRVTEALGPVDRWRGTTRRKLERLFRLLADLGAEHPAVACLALLESLRHVSSTLGERALADEEGVQRFQDLTRTILRDGQAKGELRRDVSVEHAASLIESGFFRTLAHWLVAGGVRRPLHQEITAKLDIVLNGLTWRGRARRRPGYARRILAAIVALAAPGAAAAQGADTLRLSLAQAVERALDRSEEIATARARLAQADARLTQASAAALPQVSAGITYNRTIRTIFDALAGFQGADTTRIPGAFDETRTPWDRYDTLSELMMADFMEGLASGLPFGRPNTYVSLVQVTQPLFAGGRITGARAAARHAQTATEHQLDETEADVVMQVRVAYLNTVLARRLQTIAADSRRMAAEHLRHVEWFRQAGTASEFDLLRARVDLENREPAVIQTENLARVALLDLKRLVNLPTETPVALTSTFDPEPVELDEAGMAGLMLDRPVLLAARERVALREVGLKSARGEWFPSVAFQANLGFQAYPAGVAPPGFSEWRKDWSVALAVSWQPFDGFGRNGRIGEAQALLREARSQQAQLEEGLRVELSQALGDYRTAVAQHRARRETVRLAEETHALADLRYRNGLATQLEVSDVALLLDQTRVNEVQALADYVKALARLERLTGGRLSLLRETQP